MPMDEFTDVLYEVSNGLATITINRPDRYNAFRARTVDELVLSFKRAWASDEVGVVCLTGAGTKAFCSGGDQKQRKETGDYGPSESGLFEVEALHRVIRDLPKPVVAAVTGSPSAVAMCCMCSPTSPSRQTPPLSARTARESAPSMPAWARVTWPA